MIKLYNFGSAFGLPDPSPFVMKVDVWMRMSAIPFEPVSGVANLRKAPKGKLPFIDDGGKRVADSHLIINYLRAQYDSPLDKGLSREQRAIATLVGKSLDEQLYWCLVYSRWIRADTWPLVKATFFNPLPAPMRTIISSIARHKVKRSLYLQGFGRHRDEEILLMTTEMFQALADLLGDKRYFFGERPSTLDATAYGFLSEFILSEIQNEFSERARGYENLVRYCEAIRNRYYAPVSGERGG